MNTIGFSFRTELYKKIWLDVRNLRLKLVVQCEMLPCIVSIVVKKYLVYRLNCTCSSNCLTAFTILETTTSNR